MGTVPTFAAKHAKIGLSPSGSEVLRRGLAYCSWRGCGRPSGSGIEQSINSIGSLVTVPSSQNSVSLPCMLNIPSLF